MAKASHREQILNVGMRVVHTYGYAGATIRDIAKAADVPQGSFTNHFPSKEAFGLAVVDLYYDNTRVGIDATLLNDALPPLERLSAFIDLNIARFKRDGMRNGCLFGNFAIETSEHSELLRNRLVAIFSDIRDSITYCLKAAVVAGELPTNTDCDGLSDFMLASLQGAELLAKAQRSAEPLERLKKTAFASLLR